MDRIEIQTSPAPPNAPVNTQGAPLNGSQVGEIAEQGIQNPAGSLDGRPQWLPEKFKSAEDLAKAYSELESRLSGSAKSEDTLEAAAVAARLTLDDVAPMSREFAETGEISEKSYKALENKGIPRELIDAYVDGQRAVAEAQVNSVYQSVGGQQNYQQMVSWASENLPPEEIDAFDALVESGNQASIQMAVRGLYARYSSAAGQPRLIQGNMSTSGSNAFRSLAELTTAMRDPRYKSDPAYRKDVEDRLRVSDVFGGPKR
jgi:hypothetical protein